MTTHKNAGAFKTVQTGDQSGGLILQRFVFDFAVASYRPAAIAADDLIQFGLVPAGFKLVPHLCCLKVPVLDSDGSPTGDYRLGTEAVTDALKGNAASETAVTLSGEDFTLTNEIGSATDDTPLYAKAVNASAAVPTSGKIIWDQVIRPIDPAVD